jgi:hypothetical protein
MQVKAWDPPSPIIAPLAFRGIGGSVVHVGHPESPA